MSLRLVLLGLLVANLLVFAWTQWIDADPGLPAATAAIVTTPTPTPTAATAAATPAADSVITREAATPQRCVSVGPFRDTAETTQAIEAFRTAGYDPQSRAQNAQINDGFWVYVDSIATVAEQRRILAAIKRAGIDDAYAMPEAGTRYMVSVGIFSDRDRAEKRAQRVRALDIAAKVDAHARSTTFYWLNMQQRSGDETLRLDVLNGAGAPAGGLTITACPAATSAPG
jgi:cell division septation protein DedD